MDEQDNPLYELAWNAAVAAYWAKHARYDEALAFLVKVYRLATAAGFYKHLDPLTEDQP